MPEPIFTPATKAAVGDHDENVSFATTAATVGEDVAEELRRLTMAVYATAHDLASERGIILADTEIGVRGSPRRYDVAGR